MNILVLHSLIAPGAPPEDQDTLIAAAAVADALIRRGHRATLAPFEPEHLAALIAADKPEVVFNLVEGIDGKGQLAWRAPEALDAIGLRYTGAGAACLKRTSDKLATKADLRSAGLATPDWSEPPHWNGLTAGRWIVKSVDEDASIGLDDGAVVEAPAVPARAALCTTRFGGAWFAERYVEGREFNIALIERNGAPQILPMAEMLFADWPEHLPRIVGYNAKWDEASAESLHTVRRFGVEENEPQLAARLRTACHAAWHLFDCRGTARVDFRVTAEGEPLILEINPNPGIAPDAGLIAAADRAGLSYADLIEGIVREAIR